MHRVLSILILVLGSQTGCDRADEPADSRDARSPRVTVVNYPLQYFAQRIADDRITVAYPGPADSDPADWRPGPTAIAVFQQSDRIFLNGAGYAGWVRHVTLPMSRIVDTSAAFADGIIHLEDAARHTHGPRGNHTHADTAYTTWLDPTLAILHAEAIHKSLASLLPAHAEEFQQRFERLRADLRDLDDAFARVMRPLADRPLFASHPVYQYFSRRYELDVIDMHWEPEALPSETQWQQFDELRQTHPSTLMLWEAPPIESIQAALEQRGVRWVALDPCATPPTSGDYLAVMRVNVKRLEQAWEPD